MTTQPPDEAPAGADTQDAGAQDTVTTTQQSQQPTDSWEARYKQLQARDSRIQQENARLKAQLEEAQTSYDEAEDEEEEEPVQRTSRRTSRTQQEIEALREQLEAERWQIAEAIYPPEVIDAYGTFAEMWNAADTPADQIAAVNAYHLRLSGQAEQPVAPAAGAEPPLAAVLPRGDSNRSDAPVLPEIANQLREAEQKRDLAAWVRAKLASGQ